MDTNKPQDKKTLSNFDRTVIGRLRVLKIVAWLAIVMERMTFAFWPMILWAGLFISIWLLGLPSIFGHWAQILCALIFWCGTGYGIWRGLTRLQYPKHSDILRKIEQDNKTPHRPLDLLHDQPATTPTKLSQSLWQKAQKSVLHTISTMKPGWPRPVIGRQDPYAIRAVICLCGIIAFFIAGAQAPQRLAYGLFPFFVPSFLDEDGTLVSLTITPPAYTALPAFRFTGIHNKGAPIDIPEGSEIKAQAHGGLGRPHLHIGDDVQPFIKLDHNNYGLISKIKNTASSDRSSSDNSGEDIPALQIKQMGFARLSTPYNFKKDTPPTLEIDQEDGKDATDYEPEITSFGALRFALAMQDDYGVRDLIMRMDLNPIVEDAPLGEPYEDIRAVMSAPNTLTPLTPTFDLSSHVWAGLPVIIELKAVDAVGQHAVQTFSLTLPERTFHHPVAAELIEMRKTLSWNYRSPHTDMVGSLIDILSEPGSYNNDMIVFLGLRAAASRLFYGENKDETYRTQSAHALIDLFWKIAVRLEDGDVNLARERMLQAQRALEQALDNPNITDQERALLMEELRQTMAEYFRELGREMQKQMAQNGNMPMVPPEMLNQMISPESLSQFFDQLESEALNGDPDKARELLSQLGKLMDMLDPGMTMAMPPDMQMMSEGVSELQELVRRQEKLLDQTRLQADKLQVNKMTTPPPRSEQDSLAPLPSPFDGFPPLPEPEPDSDLADINTETNKTEQDALRFILGQLMLEADEILGEIPENMGLAERSMLGSAQELGENRPDLSIPFQEASLEHLRKAMEDLSQQMMARMQQMTGFAFGMGQTDPLGRQTGQNENGTQWFQGSNMQIPDEAERKRIEDILELLRKRSGEYFRNEEERQYFKRLLKQF